MTGDSRHPAENRRTTREVDSRANTNTVPAVLLGLAVVCVILSGLLLFDIGGGLTSVPLVNGTADGPGLGFTGIVSAQEAEVREAYDSRSFEDRLAGATDDESRAAVLATEREQIRMRLGSLETQRNELEDIDDDDDDREYRARVTGFVAQSLILEQRLNRVEAAAEALPRPVREKFDLTEQTLGALQERVAALTTPAMLDIAREVAGDDVGDDFDDDRDDDEDADDDDQEEDDDDQDDEDDEEREGDAEEEDD